MKISLGLLLTLGFLAVTTNLSAQGTAFTYQGQLQNNGLPATGTYDFAFALFTTNNATPAQLGGTLTQTNVGVTNGLFTVALDFGPVFTGTSHWLQIAVRTNGSDAFATLSPLQPLTPVPYALFAAGANAAGLTGTLPPAQLPGTVVTNGATGLNLNGVFAGNGLGLTNVTAVALATNGQYAGFGLLTMLTNSYVSNGIYAFTIPPHITRMSVKLWGAGGDAAYFNGTILFTDGGGGAFSQVTLDVNPGDSYVLVVGQSGSTGGGAGANDGSGGAGTVAGAYTAGTGGQASSLFFQTGPNYVMKAVAGGGGGGNLYGGNAGQANGSGIGYSPNATTLGETNLNLMGGLGAAGADGTFGSGSGGGYGSGSPLPDGQSGGGGSYGDVTISGSLNVPGNPGDPNYLPGAAVGRADGLGVVIFAAPPPVATLAQVVQAPGFIGDGRGLTNLSLPALPNNIITNTATGVTLGGTFTGDGSGLTGLNITTLPYNVITNTAGGVILGGTFTGDGSSLTNVNLANAVGKLADYQMSGNVALLTNSAMPATGSAGLSSGQITSVTLVNHGAGYPTAPAVTVSGVYGLGSGAVVTAAVSNGVVTALTLVNGGSSYVFGATLAIAPPPANNNNFFAGNNIFAGPVLATNPASVFVGDGRGLANLNAANVVGKLGDYQMSGNVAVLTNSAMPASGTLTVGDIPWSISSVTLVNPGAGYPTAPVVTVSGNYGYGQGAVVSASVSNGVVTALTLVNGGSGYFDGATLSIAPPPPVNANNFFAGSNNFAGPVLATNPASVFAGNGSGLTSVPAASLTGTLPAAIFVSTTVTNFASVGPLAPASFNFSSHGGRLIITTTGSGSTLSAPIAIGMTVKLDSTLITTNRVWMNLNNHGAFVPQTLVLRNIASGSHTLTLAAWNATSTDVNDNFSVFIEELPY